MMIFSNTDRINLWECQETTRDCWVRNVSYATPFYLPEVTVLFWSIEQFNPVALIFTNVIHLALVYTYIEQRA